MSSPAPVEVSAPRPPSRWQRAWRRLSRAPDPDLVDAGLRGEWLVAGIRLLIVILLLYVPIARYLEQPFERGRQVVLWVAVAALAEALIVYVAVKRSWGRRWIGFFSGIVDVSLVTLTLGIYVRLGQPLSVTGDVVIFPVFLLAIGASALRYDWRICVVTGFAAIAEYATLVGYTVWIWDLDQPDVARLLGGEFHWTEQAGRFLVLATATALATMVVVRTSELRRLSTRDRLTDIANRGLFDESLEQIGAIASRSGEPVTVVMVDVDHFKRFNDTHGHLAGDACLQRVARCLAEAVRTTDLVARYGGEEFAVLFPGMDEKDAAWRLEQLRASIAQLPIPVDSRGTAVHVTVSVGAGIWPRDGVNLAETLAIADGRLYQAKAAGRNRVVASAGVPS